MAAHTPPSDDLSTLSFPRHPSIEANPFALQLLRADRVIRLARLARLGPSGPHEPTGNIVQFNLIYFWLLRAIGLCLSLCNPYWVGNDVEMIMLQAWISHEPRMVSND
jgi:hypothetical protein